MDEIDRIGHRAAGVLVAEVERRVDVEDALRQLHTAPATTLIALGPDTQDEDRHASRHVARWIGAAAAVAALVAGGVVLTARDENPRLGPSDTVGVTPAPTSPGTSVPSPNSTVLETVPPVTTEPIDAGVQQAVVTIDDSTPIVEGAVLLTTPPISETFWYTGAVTPNGKVFVGETRPGATFSEVVGGLLFDTGISARGSLRGGLDERLYALDPTTEQIVTWAQVDGTWTIDRTDSMVGDCDFEVQPDAVRCGGVSIATALSDASWVQWSDPLRVTVGLAEQATTWQISLDPFTLAADCRPDSCFSYARYGANGVAWSPNLVDIGQPEQRIVSLLQPDAAPVNALLDCGLACQIIGADDQSIYTLGRTAANEPSIIVHRFAFADIAAGQSTPDPAAVDMLAAFAAPPSTPPTLADVPRLLPTESIPGAANAVGGEGADDAATTFDYEQVWVADGVGAPALVITTNIDQGPAVDGDPVDLNPWDRAFFTNMGPGYAQLMLHDPSGVVGVWSRGLTRDDLLVIARSMQLRPDGRPGWLVDGVPSGLTAVSEGWGLGVASRSVQWHGDGDNLIAQLWIETGAPNVYPLLGSSETTTQVIDVNGSLAVASADTTPGAFSRAAITWSPQPGVMVQFGMVGSIDEAIAIARSFVPVDRTTWEASTTIDTNQNDGCNSLFC